MKHRSIDRTLGALLLCSFLMGLFACKMEKETAAEKESARDSLWFQARIIADTAKHWWAHVPGDIDGDGVADLTVIHNNSSAGSLGYYKGSLDSARWKWNLISEVDPKGKPFAAGDLEVADVNNDGKMDVLGVVHPGEWMDAGAEASLYWYEQGMDTWIPHDIGSVPDAVKDISFEDFDQDGRMDLAVLTFDEHTLSLFRQEESGTFSRKQFIKDTVLHEGMHTGDLNLDGFPDIVATGKIYYNPGPDLTADWMVQNLDTIWNNQTGDWSRNGTKTWIENLDGSGRPEILMSHSERSGYPLMLYAFEENAWKGYVVAADIPACHTLQVADFDLDGDPDILAGINKGRAVNLDETEFPVVIFLNSGDHQTFERLVLSKEGIYNGQVMDYDGDGDMDIFRYPQHEATHFYLLENKIR